MVAKQIWYLCAYIPVRGLNIYENFTGPAKVEIKILVLSVKNPFQALNCMLFLPSITKVNDTKQFSKMIPD